MKTITLSEPAYRRLAEWKAHGRDSFSNVVMRMVPERGTLGQVLEDVRALPRLKPDQARVMDETVAWGRKPRKEDEPWTS